MENWVLSIEGNSLLIRFVLPGGLTDEQARDLMKDVKFIIRAMSEEANSRRPKESSDAEFDSRSREEPHIARMSMDGLTIYGKKTSMEAEKNQKFGKVIEAWEQNQAIMNAGTTGNSQGVNISKLLKHGKRPIEIKRLLKAKGITMGCKDIRAYGNSTKPIKLLAEGHRQERAKVDGMIWKFHNDGLNVTKIVDKLHSEGYYLGERNVRTRLQSMGVSI
jgi:hypothetical protein